MSLGGSFSSALNTAVTNSIAAGVTYALAAGNSNANACNYSPSSTPNAITVGATTSTDAKSSFSNYGSCVDINAPGSSITSAWNTGDDATNTISGTSMASPHVAGAAAAYLSGHLNSAPAAVAAALKSAATTGRVTGLPAGTPNLLLYTHFGTSGPTQVDPSFTVSCSGYDCTFDAVSDKQTTYAWTFGDNGTGSTDPAFHTYAQRAGTYTVKLVVNNGPSSSRTVSCHQRKGCS
jgi:subtilisin family serine protease